MGAQLQVDLRVAKDDGNREADGYPKGGQVLLPPQHHAFGAKATGQTFGIATTGRPINLLRIEENLSQAWQRLSGTYVENLPWLKCAQK